MKIEKFSFGKNWMNFSTLLDENRIEAARDSLTSLLGDLNGKSFLDIGCGSGLFAIAAAQLGANPVAGIDIDPLSVQTSIDNANRWGVSDKTGFQQMSVLNLAELQKLGTFDIVYSWGVLHHTGKMYEAIRNAAALVKPDGQFMIAIYNKHATSPVWKRIKWFYNHIPVWGQRLMVYLFIPVIYMAKLLVTRKNPLATRRGMDFFYDIIDWLGGYPYEYASPDEIKGFVEALGFRQTNFIPAKVPTGCNEFVFLRLAD